MSTKAERRRRWKLVRAAVLWTAIPVLIVLWTQPISATLRGLISVAYAVFLLLAAPVWCAARNRDGTTCRNNASGLLVGCSRVRYHRWDKLTSIGRGRGIRAQFGRWFQDVPTGAAVLGVIAAFFSAGASWIQALQKILS